MPPMIEQSSYNALASEEHTRALPITTASYQSPTDRLASIESSVCLLRSETMLLRHAVTGLLSDQRLLKVEIMKHIGMVGEGCTRIEQRLSRIVETCGLSVHSDVQPSFASCPKICKGLANMEETTQSMGKKRKSPETNATVSRTWKVDGVYESAMPTASKMPKKGLGTGTKGSVLVGGRLFDERVDDNTSDDETTTTHPSQCAESMVSSARQNRVPLPDGMELEFYPTKCMKLSQREVEVAAYIFSTNLDKNALIVHCSGGDITRGELLSLSPLRWVYSEVLSMVAARMTHEERSSGSIKSWFLPPTISQQVHSKTLSIEQAMRGYCLRFMSNSINGLEKIYVPLNDNNVHWFLLVVCVNKEELLCLDSCPSSTTQAHRHDLISEMAKFFECLLKDDRFHNTRWSTIPKFSSWTIVTPPGLPLQKNAYDCGVYVGGWMTLSSIWGDYRTVPTGESGRMRLALDICLSDYNLKKDELIPLANKEWRDYANSITI